MNADIPLFSPVDLAVIPPANKKRRISSTGNFSNLFEGMQFDEGIANGRRIKRPLRNEGASTATLEILHAGDRFGFFFAKFEESLTNMPKRRISFDESPELSP